MKDYIFRFDQLLPCSDEKDTKALAARTGMRCSAEIKPEYGKNALVKAIFEDGHVEFIFAHELEDVPPVLPPLPQIVV